MTEWVVLLYFAPGICFVLLLERFSVVQSNSLMIACFVFLFVFVVGAITRAGCKAMPKIVMDRHDTIVVATVLLGIYPCRLVSSWGCVSEIQSINVSTLATIL